MNFFDAHAIKGSIDFHSFGEMIMYPWAYTYQGIPNETPLDQLTTKMASYNGYAHGQISKVIYVAKGSSADYYYWKKKTMALGIEIGSSYAPPTGQIPQMIQDNLESTWTFVEGIQ